MSLVERDQPSAMELGPQGLETRPSRSYGAVRDSNGQRMGFEAMAPLQEMIDVAADIRAGHLVRLLGDNSADRPRQRRDAQRRYLRPCAHKLTFLATFRNAMRSLALQRLPSLR